MTRLVTLILLYFLYSFTLYAENNIEYIEDSLIKNITYQEDITKQLDAYIDLIKYYQSNNFNTAIEYGVLAKEIAIKNNVRDYECFITYELVRAYLSLGEIDTVKQLLLAVSDIVTELNDNKVTGGFMYVKSIASSYENDMVQSMEYSLESLKNYKLSKDTSGMALAYNVIGINYDLSGNKQKALDYYLKSMDFANIVNNKILLNSVYNNLGVLYGDLNDKEKSLHYYNKSILLSEKANDMFTIVGGINNIALIYLGDKLYKKALASLYKALKIACKHNFKMDQAMICSNIGELYLELNKYDSARFYFQKAIKGHSEFQDSYSVASITLSLALLNEEIGNFKTAKSYYNDVIDILGENEFNEIAEEVYEQLSKLSFKSKDYKNAYKYLENAIFIRDSIGLVNIDEKLRYAKMQIDFKNKVYGFENEMLEIEKEHLLELGKENKIKYAILLVLLVVLSILLLLYLRFRKSHNVNVLLLERNKEIESQKALVEISNIEIKEQYAFTETLLNTIPNPVFYTNKKGNIIGCNKAFEKIVDATEEELIGVYIKDIQSKTSFQCDLIDKFSVGEGTQDVNEGLMELVDGTKLDIICYKQGIVESDDTLIGILGIIIDVTNIKNAERSLKSSQHKLQEAINAKDKFFSIMAHDLKNPFNAVLGLTNLISNNTKSFNEQEIQQYATLINQSATQIYNLLENLLEWSRAQSGTLVRNPVIFDIHEPIEECLDLLKSNIDQKAINIEFNYSQEFKVYVDRNMILTVIRNILMNAIKYTAHNGKIIISTSINNNTVKVCISDNGVGISKENLKKLFKIDKPISTPGVQNEKGTGLGLIICKEFIGQNSGKLYVENNQDKGTTFSFDLPAYKA